MSADHASGSVHTLTGGQNELSTFLGAAAQRNQVGAAVWPLALLALQRGRPWRVCAAVRCMASHLFSHPGPSSLLSCLSLPRQLVLVDFSASWCGPCRMMVPVLAALAAEHRGRLVVIKVDC